MIGAIGYKLSDKCEAKIYPVGTYHLVDWCSGHSSELGDMFITYDTKGEDGHQPYIIVVQNSDNEYVLRFIETKRYMLKMDCRGEESVKLPGFQNEGNKFLKCDRDRDSVMFQFINYLGKSRMDFECDDGVKTLRFEVIPDKMSYEDDYISLTEALAEVCSGLLLEYLGATSNVFSQSVNASDNLLEQFIFLRQFCYGQNLLGIFEAIKRNPDRALNQEEELKPTGNGRPSRKFYSNPFSHSRGWIKVKEPDSEVYIPQMIAATRKFDCLDTPANRFIKYALHRFDTVCVTLTEALDKEGQTKQAECYKEAVTIHNMLNEVFCDSFFVDIGDLDFMPQNNQVLQKREGYSQIFHAYAMLDLALQLDWKGKDDVYEGESKNVALLYEYWLFFELYKIIKSIDGCDIINSNESPFLIIDNGITISLKEGKKSCQSFEIKVYHIKINLYYNRTFLRTEFQTTKYEGSYSRPFRPDYTLAIFPSSYTGGGYNGEGEAIRNGAVSFVHFDAKYRVSDVTGFVEKNVSVTPDDQEFAEEKADSVVNTYKRGDLLKMHTYNDAIRRTVGSYILYPGACDQGREGKERFCLYDEILPGVGAFSIKPSIDVPGEKCIKEFILSLITSRSANNSRLNRLEYYTQMILGEPSVFEEQKVNPVVADPQMCVMGYIRGDSDDDYYNFLKRGGFLRKGLEFPFYFYAIKGKHVYSHHKDLFRATHFRFYTNQIHVTNTYKLEPFLCNIISNELIAKGELVERLQKLGYETSEAEHSADFYYVLTVKVEDESCPCDEFKVSEINMQDGNDTFSPHSPKIVFC